MRSCRQDARNPLENDGFLSSESKPTYARRSRPPRRLTPDVQLHQVCATSVLLAQSKTSEVLSSCALSGIGLTDTGHAHLG